ncbi:hypothetical protein HAX54_010167 [Datura stramonium]|uniref:Uncharacterized protein n=1 Tax=Datura stramonium TaxID=4076 RepID=A0ABS8X0F9_DATST|nr:hypothetical protein [Datura stramonium]
MENTLNHLNSSFIPNSIQNISFTILPHPNPTTYGIPPHVMVEYTSTPNNSRVMNIQPATITTSVAERQPNMLVLRRYGRTAKEIQTVREIPIQRRIAEEEMPSRNIQSLSYEDLCICLDLILPPGFKLPKFNTFDGKRNPITH